MEEDELVGSAAIGLHGRVLLLQAEQVMRGIEAELVLEHRCRVLAIPKAILDLLLDGELVLVYIGDDGGWVEMGQVDDEVHF